MEPKALMQSTLSVNCGGESVLPNRKELISIATATSISLASVRRQSMMYARESSLYDQSGRTDPSQDQFAVEEGFQKQGR